MLENTVEKSLILARYYKLYKFSIKLFFSMLIQMVFVVLKDIVGWKILKHINVLIQEIDLISVLIAIKYFTIFFGSCPFYASNQSLCVQ